MIVMYRDEEAGMYRWLRFDARLQCVGHGEATTKADIERDAKAEARRQPEVDYPEGFEPEPSVDEVRWAKETELDLLAREASDG